MIGKPIKVIVYGLFPTAYSLCSPCCTRDYLSYCSPGYEEEQLREYPEKTLKGQELLERIIEELAKCNANLKIEIVSADSLKGLLLSAKHRLGLGPALIVEDRVFRVDGHEGLMEAKKYIESLGEN